MGDAGHVGADGPTEAQVERMFLALDADGSGRLELGEIAALAQNLGQDMSEEDLDDAMAEMDEDDSGGVELTEFKHWFIAQFGVAEEPEPEPEPEPEDDLRTKIVKIYEARLGADHARRKVSEVDSLLARWKGTDAALLKNVMVKYGVKDLSSVSTEKLTLKALAARAERDRLRSSAKTPPQEISMRVENERVHFRIVTNDEATKKREQVFEDAQLEYQKILANKIQIEWRMSVKRHARNRVSASTAIAAHYRGWRVRTTMLHRLAVMTIQLHWRRYHTRRHVVLLELFDVAVRYIQRRVRWRQSRHRERKAVLAREAVKACWERQARRHKDVVKRRKERQQAAQARRKAAFQECMAQVKSYHAEQEAKRAAIEAAEAAERQRVLEEQARKIIRKHLIRHLLRMRLRAKVKERRAVEVQGMQSMLNDAIANLLQEAEEKEALADDAATGQAAASKAAADGSGEALKALAGAGTGAAAWRRKAKTLRVVGALGRSVVAAEGSAATEDSAAPADGGPALRGKAGLQAASALIAPRKRRKKKKPGAAAMAVMRLHRSGAMQRRTPDRLAPLEVSAE